MRWVPEVANVDKPNQNANNGNNLCQHVTEIVQLALKGSLLADLRRNGLVNVTNGSFLASEDDDSLCISVDDSGTLEVVNLD